MKPVAEFVTKFRFYLYRLSFYITLMVHDARNMFDLGNFLTTFLTTSLIAVIKTFPRRI
jgi:hypothetical protein